jgi:hypothetical protein
MKTIRPENGNENARAMRAATSRERLEAVVFVAGQRGVTGAEYIRRAVFETLSRDLDLTSEELESVNLSDSEKFMLIRLVAEQHGLGVWEYIVHAMQEAIGKDLHFNFPRLDEVFHTAEPGLQVWC